MTRSNGEPDTRYDRWLRCAEKRCCVESTVYVTARDVATIARTISVPPWEFAYADVAPIDADDGFALDATARRYRLALRRTSSPGEAAHCTFLLRFATGAARCGLGETRPASCRVFPLAGGEDACTCAIARAPRDDPGDLAALAALGADRDAYARIVTMWNAFVVRSDTAFVLRDYCRFVLDAENAAGR